MMARGETWASAVLAGVLLMVFFAWNVTQRDRKSGSEMKCSDKL